MSNFVRLHINFSNQRKNGVVDFKAEKTIIIDDEVVVLLHLSNKVTYLLGRVVNKINVVPNKVNSHH